jgi:hypothetical protein
VQIAELPEMIRGYEGIKLATVDEFHHKVEALFGQFRHTEATLTTA